MSSLDNWMQSLDSDLSISDIKLPGTHDSAAISWYTTPAACQAVSIANQLHGGVRLLDIRLMPKQSGTSFEFQTCHGSTVFQYESFDSVMQQCEAHLTANPLEFIAVSLKFDTWNGITDQNGVYAALTTKLGTYPIYRSSLGNLPKLKDVRGKIYLINRITTDQKFGVPIAVPDNQSALVRATTNRNFDVYVQDQYSMLYAGAKLTAFQTALTMSKPGQLLLNFGSAVTPLGLGIDIKGALLNWFGVNPVKTRPAPSGWSLFDFALSTYTTTTYGSMTCVEFIIDANSANPKYSDTFKVLQNDL